jgi:hypothetical protein
MEELAALQVEKPEASIEVQISQRDEKFRRGGMSKLFSLLMAPSAEGS